MENTSSYSSRPSNASGASAVYSLWQLDSVEEIMNTCTTKLEENFHNTGIIRWGDGSWRRGQRVHCVDAEAVSSCGALGQSDDCRPCGSLSLRRSSRSRIVNFIAQVVKGSKLEVGDGRALSSVGSLRRGIRPYALATDTIRWHSIRNTPI